MTTNDPRAVTKSLFAAQRRERIMDELRARGAISVKVLAAQLGVSELTIRRDVNAMADQGLLSRVHGGATLRNDLQSLSTEQAPAELRYNIGMVVPSLDYYWPQVVNGARAEAEKQHVRIVLRGSTYDAADNRSHIQRLVDSRNIHGLIVAPVTSGEAGHELLRWLNTLPIPVVLAERRSPPSIPAQRLEWVATDHAFGAAMAVSHLWKEGHRGIGCLADIESPTSAHVFRGWEQALRALGVPEENRLKEDSHGAKMPNREAFFDKVLERCRATKTTAILVHSDGEALAFVQHCQDSGLSIPDDIAVVSYDDEVAHLAEPAITAVRPPKMYVGRLAVEMITSRLTEGHRRPVHRIELNPDLIIRESSVGGRAARS
ncbi:DNA-binding transcriptional regulator [Arthrobacter alpinus]|uniref:substrate-binding domain-containing protein n=1 Tax=Arthrobacter alpinus TaxID=656366 RepID=UPI0005CA1A90|nr:substrate-binding domain-containing protein [Arthrobacter alpinus]ALV46367.1 DNA-binding transcriptional regulator [Arthrobacter alpinus]